MITHWLGVDGGGTGCRVRLAHPGGLALAQARGGPAALALGVTQAWNAIEEAVQRAFEAAELARPPAADLAIGLGLAGANHRPWATEFEARHPGYGLLVLANDGYTTLLGAHQGRPGAVVAIGTGSVGMALWPDGDLHEVGGWGFPAGDEASGAWLGLRAVKHLEQALDGRQPSGPLARALAARCGTDRASVLSWVTRADQTRFAQLAPVVVEHADDDAVAHALMLEAADEVQRLIAVLDPSGDLPLCLSGGLGESLQRFLGPTVAARCVAPRGDSAQGALRLLAEHLKAIA